jgi:hypothetical protein
MRQMDNIRSSCVYAFVPLFIESFLYDLLICAIVLIRGNWDKHDRHSSVLCIRSLTLALSATATSRVRLNEYETYGYQHVSDGIRGRSILLHYSATSEALCTGEVLTQYL